MSEFLSRIAGGGQAAGAVQQLLDSQGGLDGLLSRLRQAGLGEQVDSWIGNGANQPVSPQALEPALGGDILSRIEQRIGLDRGELLMLLSQALPVLINLLTPHGRVEPGQAAPQGGQSGGGSGGLLESVLGRVIEAIGQRGSGGGSRQA
ncbi:YidB family protein [Roseomonas acroporae]